MNTKTRDLARALERGDVFERADVGGLWRVQVIDRLAPYIEWELCEKPTGRERIDIGDLLAMLASGDVIWVWKRKKPYDCQARPSGEDSSKVMHCCVDARPLEETRHVYVHPDNEDLIRPAMRKYGIDQHAELHLDPRCPPRNVYWCVKPLEGLPA